MEFNKNAFVDLIKAKVKEQNTSVNKMLQDCNLSKSFVYDIDKKDVIPSIENIIKIADYFNVPIDYLLGRNSPSVELSKEHKELIDLYEKLNHTGKNKAIDNIKDLTKIKDYTEEYAEEIYIKTAQ